jgi:hypothetical protein
LLERNESIYKLDDNIVIRKNDGTKQYWAFNTESGDHYCLNSTSYWILERISSEPGTIDDVLTHFLQSFQVGYEEAKKDFEEIIESFLLEGIIEKEGEKNDES